MTNPIHQHIIISSNQVGALVLGPLDLDQDPLELLRDQLRQLVFSHNLPRLLPLRT